VSSVEDLRPFVELARSGRPLAHAPRILGESLPWDYPARARLLAARAERILDLTTGTGELLAQVLEESCALAVGADRRRRHFDVARDRLRDRVSFVRASPEATPFRPESFDLVLLRHRPFDVRDLAALVAPGGAVLAEQIHARNWRELREYFPRMPRLEDYFEVSKTVFRRAGFELIDVRTHDRPLAFDGIGHLVYTLASAPWIVPDFDLDRDAEALARLEADLEDERGIVLTRSRYVLELRRPPPLD